VLIEDTPSSIYTAYIRNRGMENGLMEEGRVNLKSPHLPSLQLTSGIEGWKGVEKGIMEEGRVNRG
jgi:hypothetical protein